MDSVDDYEIPRSNKNARNIALLTAGCILAVLLVFVVYYETKVNKPATSESNEIEFTVSKGLSTRQIAYGLNYSKVIDNPTVFLIYITLHSAGNKIQAGQYSLNSNMVIPEIVDILTHGKVVFNERILTIIEGWSNKQIGSYLEQRQIIPDSSKFDALLKTSNFDFKFKDLAKQFNYQGFLFPDTYKLALDAMPDQLIAKMLKNFEAKITNQMLADIQSQHRTLKDIVILASIIEKEVGRNQTRLTPDDLAAMQHERELAASVFYNRLAKSMKLESDATVNYVTGKADRSILYEDSKIKSPYNTYQVYGLPPTPICNPGIGSLKAAIYPAKSDYLYFVNKLDGEAVFAKTLQEHNANIAKYLH